MCFSAEASFAAGTVLIPAGIYCIRESVRKNPAFLPLAAVPVFFGIQQIAEGVVWHGLEHGQPELVHAAAMIFLFFALAFWPFWWPFLASSIETRPGRRRTFAVLSVLAIGWFVVLYLPILQAPPESLQVHIVHHSIRYEYPESFVFQILPRPVVRLLYLLCVAVPMVFGSVGLGRLPGIVMAATGVVAILFFNHAFISVWCFFAAVLVVYLVWVFRHLPAVSMAGGELARLPVH